MCRFIVLFFLSFCTLIWKLSGQHLDPLQTEKCRMRCSFLNLTRPDEITCLRKCLKYDIKPGRCPTELNTTTISKSDNVSNVCSNSCTSDTQCNGMRKCCPPECGECMTPTHVDLFPGIPPKPTEVKIHVNESDIVADGIPIYVQWTYHSDKNYEPIQYVVEERHDYDGTEVEFKNENWTVVKRTPHKHAMIKDLFQPGVYYQFRVYAVNENGTVGPSEPCKPNRISPNITELAPGVPIDFGVGAQSWGNGTLRFLLVWKTPPSAIPIYRYKLTSSMLSNSTLYQSNKYFAGNMDHYWLGNILPKKEYFFELNAVSRFNEKKIPGKPARIVVRTHDRPPPKKRRKIKATEMNLKYKDRIRNIRVDKLFWIQDSLFADIAWDPVDHNVTIDYSLTWSPHVSCKEYDAWYVAKAIEPVFELYDLVPGCNYFISVKAIHNDILYSANVSIPFDECVHKRKIHKKKEYFPAGDIIRHFENRPIDVVDCPLTTSNRNY